MASLELMAHRAVAAGHMVEWRGSGTDTLLVVRHQGPRPAGDSVTLFYRLGRDVDVVVLCKAKRLTDEHRAVDELNELLTRS